jgi:outer membrane protein assembly factor BamB
VHLDEVDSTVRAHLERVKAYVADGQWDEAVETLRQVMESHAGKVINLAGRRYINLADYCHLQIAALPPPALELYRQRVDPLAQKWCEEGIATRNATLLANVVHQMFCSSYGDEALMALGEIALEEGRPSIARGYWEQIVERPPERIAATKFETAVNHEGIEPADRDEVLKWYRLDESTDPAVYRLRHDEYQNDDSVRQLVQFWRAARLPASRLAYPSTSLELADVRARLVLASILEGSLSRAKGELEALRHTNPDAAGALAGRQQPYAAALERMIGEADEWPARPVSDDWPTFAGNSARNKVARQTVDIGAELWPAILLGEPLMADVANSQKFSAHRVGERSDSLLSYHPVVSGDLLLFCNLLQVFAFDLRTGKPAWPGDPKKKPGEIYSEEIPGAPLGRTAMRGLGVPRFTLTVAGGKLYARMGSQVTTRPVESYESHAGSLVCLDLNAQGRLLWKIAPDDDKWAFEGAPLVDGTDVYVAMRKSDVRPQAHVACFDAETGRRRWRTMVSSAETPAGGQAEELTHNLLTLEQGVLFTNTNLGAVAAIAARDGHVLWISTYPRAKRSSSSGQDKRAAHFYRDLNPCIYYRGILAVAPSDSEYILAFDATTGQMLWDSHLAADAVHLLGVGGGNLIASGDHLWWLDIEGGKVMAKWPEQSPPGYGRGILAGDKIYWPTRDALYVFDQHVSRPGQAPIVRDPILLNVDKRQAGGGNLVIGQGVMLIATPNKLFAFGSPPGATSTAGRVSGAGPPEKAPANR